MVGGVRLGFQNDFGRICDVRKEVCKQEEKGKVTASLWPESWPQEGKVWRRVSPLTIQRELLETECLCSPQIQCTGIGRLSPWDVISL